MQHLDEGTIHSLLDGALSADEAARVEAHVKECAQCQAAVAEARGFIAASSRILTALDNAPRGVIPAAVPRKRIDPMVWRIAASVLVVALGSALVIREQGTSYKTNAPLEAIDSTCAPDCTPSDFAPPVTILAKPRSSVAAGSDKAGSGKREAGGAAEQPAILSRRAGVVSGVATIPPARTGASVTAKQQSRVDGEKSSAFMGKVPARENANAAAADAQPTAAPAIVLRGSVLTGRAAGVMGADAAAEPKLRVVGTPRALGQKITLYEVAPGDTVVLSEQLRTELQQVVTAAAAAAAPPRAMGAVSGERARASAKVGSFADTPSKAAEVAPVPAPTASPTTFTLGPGGVPTLTWKDSATRTEMKLSGRHTRAELEEIKVRIERARSAAADSATKSR